MNNFTKHTEKNPNHRSMTRESTFKNSTNKRKEELELKLSGQPVSFAKRVEAKGGRDRGRISRRPMSALPLRHSRTDKEIIAWRRPQSAEQSPQNKIITYQCQSRESCLSESSNSSKENQSGTFNTKPPTSSSTDECDTSETPTLQCDKGVHTQTSSSLSHYNNSKCDVAPWTEDELIRYCDQAESNFESLESILSDECDPSEKSLGEKISFMAREQFSIKFLSDIHETVITKPPLPATRNFHPDSVTSSESSYLSSRLRDAERQTDLLLQKLANQDLSVDYSECNYGSYLETLGEHLQSMRSRHTASFKPLSDLNSPINTDQLVNNYVSDNLKTSQKGEVRGNNAVKSQPSLTEHILGTSENYKTKVQNLSARFTSERQPKYIRAKGRPISCAGEGDEGSASVLSVDDIDVSSNSYNLKGGKNQQISPHCDDTHRNSNSTKPSVNNETAVPVKELRVSKSTDDIKLGSQRPFSLSNIEPYVCESSCLTNSSRSSLSSSFKSVFSVDQKTADTSSPAFLKSDDPVEPTPQMSHCTMWQSSQSEVDTYSSVSKLFSKSPRRTLHRSRSMEPIHQTKPLTASCKSYSFLTIQPDSSENSRQGFTPSRHVPACMNGCIKDDTLLLNPSKVCKNFDSSLLGLLQSPHYQEHEQPHIPIKHSQNTTSQAESMTNLHNIETPTNNLDFIDLEESNEDLCSRVTNSAPEVMSNNDPTPQFKHTHEHLVPEMSSKATITLKPPSVSPVHEPQKEEENQRKVSFNDTSWFNDSDGRNNSKDSNRTVCDDNVLAHSAVVSISTEKCGHDDGDADISDELRTNNDSQDQITVPDDKFLMGDLLGSLVQDDFTSLPNEILEMTHNNSAKVVKVKTAYDDIINILEVLEGEDSSSFSCLDSLMNEPELQFTSNIQSYHLSASEDSTTSLVDIFSYLDQIDRKTLSVLSEARPATRASSLGRADSPALHSNVGEKSQMRLEELLKLNVVELAHMVYTLNFQVEDKAKSVRLLKKTLTEERQKNETLVKKSEKKLNTSLKEQKDQYELTIARHQTFIDQLISDKKSLTNKVESVVLEMKSLEERHVKNIKTLEERHGVEIQRAKEMQAANNKLRMDRLLDTRTKKIKEQTVKGLEPELDRMMSSHAHEMSELRQLHQHELHEVELRAARKTEQAMEQLRQQLQQESYNALARERDSLKLRVEKAVEQEEMLFQEHRQRLLNETNREKRRLEEELNETKRDHAKMIAHMRQEHHDNLESVKRRHEANLSSLREELEAEKEIWLHSYKKQKESELHSREQELWEELKKERDRQIDMAVATLSEESEHTKKEITVGVEKKIRKLTEKYEAEMKELEASEKTARAKYSEIKSQLIAQDDMITELRASVRQLEKELQEERKISETFSAERTHVKEAIRQEFLGKISMLEQELSRVRNELATNKSKFEVELGTLKTVKEREMQAVYNRVRTTVAQRDLTIEELSGKCRQLQELLEAQRKEYLLK